MKLFSPSDGKATPVTVVTQEGLKQWRADRSAYEKKWMTVNGFTGTPGKTCLIPGADGSLSRVVLGISDPLEIWDTAGLARNLPDGLYRLDGVRGKAAATRAALGWALGSYRFDAYRKPVALKTSLCWPKACDTAHVTRVMEATFLVRDLINTPADDMGPSELEKAARALALQHGAKFKALRGEQLLAKNFPTIHAIGRASDDAPRLLDLTWGRPRDPKVTLVGKGVCFDTGGLDIKPAAGMKLMKKDMGGAAHVLGVAALLMAAKVRVRLRVLIPAVENSIAGNAIRPLDVITSRSGKTIEIGHTDAEGRVILADALSEAAREKPRLIIDFATLTGAARVALGTELPALFSNDDLLAERLLQAGTTEQDPMWRLPLWPGYRRLIKSKTADITNAPDSGFGGAITAALFLQEFIEPSVSWAHIDLMAWNAGDRPGRPEGGEAMGIRAVYAAIVDHISAQ